MSALSETCTPAQLIAQRSVDHLARNLRGYDARFLFALTSDRKCSDPRDRIFAILGLLPPDLTQHILTLYSLPVGDVYTQVFLAAIRTTCRLGVIDFASPLDNIDNHFTWRPDFTKSVFERYSVAEGSFASSNSAAQVVFQQPHNLHVRGISGGLIRAISPTVTSHAKDDYPRICAMISTHFSNFTEEECLDAYLWTMTQGHLRDRWDDHSTTPSLQQARAIFRYTCANATDAVPEIFRDWVASNLTRQSYGRYFVTDRGQLGCGPTTVLPGDEICVASGSDHPIILRDTLSDAKYRYIGPSYVHGMMEGQAFLGPLPPSWHLTIDHVGHISKFSFSNRQTREKTSEDPRLGSTRLEWEPIEKEDSSRLRFYVQHHQHKTTGEIINSDPRLQPDALKARGVDLKTFTII
jgi:hypothetical protein